MIPRGAKDATGELSVIWTGFASSQKYHSPNAMPEGFVRWLLELKTWSISNLPGV